MGSKRYRGDAGTSGPVGAKSDAGPRELTGDGGDRGPKGESDVGKTTEIGLKGDESDVES